MDSRLLGGDDLLIAADENSPRIPIEVYDLEAVSQLDKNSQPCDSFLFLDAERNLKLSQLGLANPTTFLFPNQSRYREIVDNIPVTPSRGTGHLDLLQRGRLTLQSTTRVKGRLSFDLPTHQTLSAAASLPSALNLIHQELLEEMASAQEDLEKSQQDQPLGEDIGAGIADISLEAQPRRDSEDDLNKTFIDTIPSVRPISMATAQSPSNLDIQRLYEQIEIEDAIVRESHAVSRPKSPPLIPSPITYITRPGAEKGAIKKVTMKPDTHLEIPQPSSDRQDVSDHGVTAAIDAMTEFMKESYSMLDTVNLTMNALVEKIGSLESKVINLESNVAIITASQATMDANLKILMSGQAQLVRTSSIQQVMPTPTADVAIERSESSLSPEIQAVYDEAGANYDKFLKSHNMKHLTRELYCTIHISGGFQEYFKKTYPKENQLTAHFDAIKSGTAKTISYLALDRVIGRYASKAHKDSYLEPASDRPVYAGLFPQPIIARASNGNSTYTHISATDYFSM
ncbi:hypothetical protein 2 [Jimsystermes virus]|uniref:Uncharacterized protein n=1 Tax=Jimsystermes virus TaxID=2796600 RepID=A0AAE7PCX9_9MONO|nr:hypothetical protein 2 [Jimsystermes virus]QQM16272.1 hypothetical protein 2 [Jimsystermes virus]